MHSKVSINVVSIDVNVIQRYSKPLMYVHKVQITNLDEFLVGKKTLKLGCIIKTGHRDFRFWGSDLAKCTDLPRPLSNNLWIIPSQKVDWDRETFSIRNY